jgi:UDP-N-acetylmuramoyl-tripeptide--D-alanyl-D-alanine ligase
VESLPEDGMAFLNHEDFLCLEMARRARCPTVRFGFDTSADLWGVRRMRAPGGIAFHLYGKMEMYLPVPGLHNAMNALAAIGVALRCGVEPGTIQERLRTARLPEMRLSSTRVGGVTLINDAYNANPGSVDAAIAELAGTPCEGQKTLVIGDMFELGAYAEQLHRKVGSRAAAAGIHRVWAVGEHAEDVERGLYSVERWNGEFHLSPSTEVAEQEAPFELEPGDTVLVKGSRRMRMERLFELLRSLAANLVTVPESVEG